MLLQYKEEKWGFAGKGRLGDKRMQSGRRTSTNAVSNGSSSGGKVG